MSKPYLKQVAERLNPVQRDKLLGIATSLLSGDYFRLDEGEHHAPYTALRKLGLLGRHSYGDSGSFYFVTPLGLAVRELLATTPPAADLDGGLKQ